LQFFHAAAAVDRADAVHPGSLGAFHIVQPVAHHGGAPVTLRQRPADHFRLAQLGVAVRFTDDPVEKVPEAVMAQDAFAQITGLGRSQRHINAVFLQDAEHRADAGINGIAVHALRTENMGVAVGSFVQSFRRHVQQVVKGITQGRPHHLPQLSTLRNFQPHFLHGFDHRGNDAFLRVKQCAVQIENHRIVRKMTHAGFAPSPLN